MFRVVAHLRDLEERTGRRVKLAIEPEPACYLETTDETLEWFTDRVYSRAGVSELAEVANIPLSEAEAFVLANAFLGVMRGMIMREEDASPDDEAIEEALARLITVFAEYGLRR